MQSSKPDCPNRQPIQVSTDPSKTYYWCTCGKSKKQPFCDGAHSGTSFSPLPFKPKPGETTVYLCQCKRTENAPYCDGAHSNNKLDW